MAKKNTLSRLDLTVEFEGKSYITQYYVDSNMVTISSIYGNKSTKVGNSPPELIAEIMFREILTYAKHKGTLEHMK